MVNKSRADEGIACCILAYRYYIYCWYVILHGMRLATTPDNHRPLDDKPSDPMH